MKTTYKEKIIIHYWYDKNLALRYYEALLKLEDNYGLYSDSFSEVFTPGLIPDCPLCDVKEKNRCADCPWTVLTGKLCRTMEYTIFRGLVSNRKKQLRFWIESFEAGIIELLKI